MREFHLSNFEFGEVSSVFSMIYALTAPLAGVFIDRVGLDAGASISVIVWSLAGAATGLTQSFRGLLVCRTMLGIAEAAGIPGRIGRLDEQPVRLASAFDRAISVFVFGLSGWIPGANLVALGLGLLWFALD